MIPFREMLIASGISLGKATSDQLYQEATNIEADQQSLARKYRILAQYRSSVELRMDDVMSRWLRIALQRYEPEIPSDWLRKTYEKEAHEYERAVERDLQTKLEDLWDYLHQMEEEEVLSSQ